MGLEKLILGAVAVGVFVCVIHYVRTRKKNKVTGCGGGCSHCPYSGGCSSQKKDED